MDYLELGSSPTNENCIQVNPKEDYLPKMKEELKRYKQMLEKRFPFPDNTSATYFGIKFFQHDFGSYGEVVIYFREWDNFVSFIEDNLPETWNDETILEYKEETKEDENKSFCPLCLEDVNYCTCGE